MANLPEVIGAVYRKELAGLERLTEDEANATDDDGLTPLMHAILASDFDASIIRLLIRRGSNVNAADYRQHWTPLHIAARDTDEEIVQALLDAGALVDAPNIFGNSPLWEVMMSAKKDVPIIKKLLAHGADPNMKNIHEVSPLDLARSIGREDLLVILGQEKKSAS